MTPQQKKADELVERFLRTYKVSLFPPFHKASEEAIQCAIICVEEILELPIYWCTQELSNSNPEGAPPSSTEEYWQSVLNELKSRL